MNLRHLAVSIRSSLKAVLAGWVAATIVTSPMQISKIVANSFGGPWVLLLSLLEGAAVWSMFSLAIAAGGWLFGLVPVVLLVPQDWLLRHRGASLALAALFGWSVVLIKFEVWMLLLPNQSLGVRIFTLYSLLLVVFTTVSAAVYLRLVAPTEAKS